MKEFETTWNFTEGGAEETSKKSIRVSTARAFIEKIIEKEAITDGE